MATLPPWHSARHGEVVHHDNDRCLAGQRIDYYWIRHNMDARPLCRQCAWMNAQERTRKRQLDA